MSTINLRRETLDILEENGKTVGDIHWVGSKNGCYEMDIDNFLKLFDFEYDNGYGGHKVCADLVVVGQDWWLERGEYDGSEWWEFKTIPAVKMEPVLFTKSPYGYNMQDVMRNEK